MRQLTLPLDSMIRHFVFSNASASLPPLTTKYLSSPGLCPEPSPFLKFTLSMKYLFPWLKLPHRYWQLPNIYNQPGCLSWTPDSNRQLPALSAFEWLSFLKINFYIKLLNYHVATLTHKPVNEKMEKQKPPFSVLTLWMKLLPTQ